MAAEYYLALKEADAALGIEDPAAAADSLKGATQALEHQLFQWRDAKRIAREAGEWPRIVVRARSSELSAAVFAAINAVESADDDMIDPTSPVWLAGTAALLQSGDLTQGTLDAINALGTVSRRLLDHDPSDADIIAARTQF